MNKKAIDRARVGFAIVNVLLIAILVVEEKHVLFTAQEVHLDPLPVNKLAIGFAPRDESMSRYSVIWEQIDRVPVTVPAGPPPPLPETLEGKIQLALVGAAPESADRGCILQILGGPQVMLHPGETSDGLTCTGIEGEGLDWCVSLTNARGVSARIRLAREDARPR